MTAGDKFVWAEWLKSMRCPDLEDLRKLVNAEAKRRKEASASFEAEAAKR